MNRNLALGLLAALAAALIGSGWQIASRHGVTTTLGPLELAVLRYGVPTLVLLPLCLKTGLLPAGVPRARLAMLLLGGALPFGLVVLAGARWAPAAHMGVYMSGSVPLFTALGAWLAGGEKLGGPRLAGLALIVCGMLAFGVVTQRLGGQPGAWRGDLLFLLAAMMWAMHTLAFRGTGLTPWQGAAIVNGWSLLMLLPVVLVWGAPRLLTAPWTDVAWQALGQGVVAGLLGLVTYMAAIVRLGAARASLSAALVPLMTALGAAWLLGEPLDTGTLMAAGVVACGVALAGGALRTGRQQPAQQPGSAVR
ncbi:MAG: DMT family transporter [Pseudomonadota bacterium]